MKREQKILASVLGVAALCLLVDRVFLGGASSGPMEVRADDEILPDSGAGDRVAHDSKAAVDLHDQSTPDESRVAKRFDAIKANLGLQDAMNSENLDAFQTSEEWLSILQIEVADDSHATPNGSQNRVDVFLKEHKLTSVMRSESSSFAIIDGDVFKPMDELDGFLLVSISDRYALFEDGELHVLLELEETL